MVGPVCNVAHVRAPLNRYVLSTILVAMDNSQPLIVVYQQNVILV